jgi:hypothetical protein
MMSEQQNQEPWIYHHWPALWGVLAAGSALALWVAFDEGVFTQPYWYAWVLIPVAWTHEFEEYFIGNFWRWYNRTCFKSKEDFFPLTRQRAFLINGSSAIPLVLQAFLISAFDFNALTLFLMLTVHANAWFHITYTVGEERYSPGFWTSLLLYLPLSIYGLYDLTIITGAVTPLGFVVGFVVSLLAGFGLFGYLRRIAQSEPERLYSTHW